MMMKVHFVAFLLVAIGAINWGLVGLFNFNLVTAFGLSTGIVDLIYIVIGLSGLYILFTHPGDCSMCAKMMGKKKRR